MPKETRITGATNALDSVVRQVGKPEAFTYDPAARSAVSQATLARN